MSDEVRGQNLIQIYKVPISSFRWSQCTCQTESSRSEPLHIIHQHSNNFTRDIASAFSSMIPSPAKE